MGAQFETQVKLQADPNVRYVAFDFHEVCKNNKYENLSILLEQVKDDLQNQGYLGFCYAEFESATFWKIAKEKQFCFKKVYSEPIVSIVWIERM